MRDPADIGFVDAHAKGNGCADDQPVFLLETAFDDAAVFGLHPAVVVAGAMASLVQGAGEGFGLGAGAGVDDAGLPFAGSGEVEDLFARAIFDCKGEVDVGAVETMQERRWFLTGEEFLHNLIASFRISSCCEGSERDIKCFA